VLSIAWLPWHVDLVQKVERRVANDGELYGDLRLAGQAPEVRAAFARCRPLTAADHRPMPFIRWWLGGPPGSVTTLEDGASPLGRMLLIPRRVATTRRIYGEETYPEFTVPAGWRQVYRNRSWRVWAAPAC
jgi:hypothetical protein